MTASSSRSYISGMHSPTGAALLRCPQCPPPCQWCGEVAGANHCCPEHPACEACEGNGVLGCSVCGELASAVAWHPCYEDRPREDLWTCCAACLPAALEDAAVLRGAA